MDIFTVDQIEEYAQIAIELALSYVPKLLLALITLFIGFRVIRIIGKTVRLSLERRAIDPSLRGFIVSLAEMALKVMLAISVAGMIGIEMTSFIAVLGAAGVAIGMALSGTLQNFAGGFLILVLRPYKVGDFIEVAGYAGSVKEIMIFNTVLTSPDNKQIIIPNATIANGSLINYSAEPTRRIEWNFGIGYDDDFQLAKETIKEILLADGRVLQEPEPYLAVSALGDSSVVIIVRAWVANADFLTVNHQTIERVKQTFDEKGISFPFPQRDVHLQQG